MAELIQVRSDTSDGADASSQERPPEGSNSRGVSTGTGERQLAWPNLVCFDAEVSDDKKQEYLVKAINLYKRRFLYKNIIIVSLAFLFAQTSFYNVAAMREGPQSNNATPVYAGQLIYYLLIVLVLLFLSPWATVKLGSKRSLVVGLLLYLACILFNVYVHLSTTIFAQASVALGTAFVWISVGCYVTQVGSLLNEISGTSREYTVYALFGYFYFIYHFAEVWKSMMSGYILFIEEYRVPTKQLTNTLLTCGAFYCPMQLANNTPQYSVVLDIVKVYTFHGANIIMCLLSVISVILCVSKLERKETEDDPSCKREVIEITDKVIGEASATTTDCSQLWIFASWYQMKNKQQLFLIPLTIYSGLQEAFFMHNFNQSYTACTFGRWTVILTTILSGCVTSLLSIVFSQLVKNSGRISLFVIGVLIQSALLLTLFLWNTDTGWIYGYFIISGLWAIGNAVLQCLLHGFYAVLFADKQPEVVFSNHCLWRHVGYFMLYTFNFLLCNYVQIFIIISVLTLAMVGYFAVEVPLYKHSRS